MEIRFGSFQICAGRVKPKWPERLVVVRHAQSELNVARDLLEEGLADKLRQLASVRDVDIDITGLGERQADETGKYLARMPRFDVCFTSPYKRAVRTAERIATQLHYDIHIFKDYRLGEKEFGVLHGLTSDDIKEQFPHEYAARQRDGKYWHRLPGGENYPDVGRRVHEFMDKLVRDYGGRHVLVTTHHVPYLMFRALFEHLGEEEMLALSEVPNCGMQEYILDTSRVPEGRMKLVDFNRVAYRVDGSLSIRA